MKYWITIASPASKRPVRKIIRKIGEKIETESFTLGKTICMRRVEFGKFEEMARLLDGVSDALDEFLLPGKQLNDTVEPQLRRKIDRPGEAATLCDAPGHVWVVDIDKMEIQSDPRDDVEATITEVLDAFPEQFKQASCWYELSASAGLTPGRVSAHIAWLTRRPLTNAEKKELARSLGLPVDPSVHEVTQPIYLGAPQFVDMDDPLPVRRGVLRRESDLLDIEKLLASCPEQSADAAQAKLDELCREIMSVRAGNPRHPVINRCAFAAGRSLVPPLDEDVVIDALLDAVSRMEDPKSPDLARDEIRRAVQDGCEASRRGGLSHELHRSKKGTILKQTHNVVVLLSAPLWQRVFAFDERAQRVRVEQLLPIASDLLGASDAPPRDLCDEDLTRVRVHLERSHKVSFSKEMVADAISIVARRNAFDPVSDFLRKLKWDGTRRIETSLVDLWGADDTPYVRAASKRTFLQFAARGLFPGCKADLVLLLIGPQGRKKSLSLLALFGNGWLSQGMSTLGTKDAFLDLLGAWCVELAELDAFGRKENATIKAFLSKTEDTYRPPYGRTTTRVKRRQVFVGTTNEVAPFRDSTGARRFVPVEVGTIDVEGILKLREQLFAEAVALINKGEQWHFTDDETSLAAEAQAERYVGDPWEQLIAEELEKQNQRGTLRDFVTTKTLLQIVAPLTGHSRVDELRLAKVMPRLGYRATRLSAALNTLRPRGWHKDIGLPGETSLKRFAFEGVGL